MVILKWMALVVGFTPFAFIFQNKSSDSLERRLRIYHWTLSHGSKIFNCSNNTNKTFLQYFKRLHFKILETASIAYLQECNQNKNIRSRVGLSLNTKIKLIGTNIQSGKIIQFVDHYLSANFNGKSLPAT